jgi:hypothetical protein
VTSFVVAAMLAATWPLTVAAQARSPVIQQRVRLDPSQPVGFHVLMTPDTVFVGEQATYELGVFISESAQQRMRRNPEVVPAELRGVLAYDLGGPQSLPAITQNGVRSFPHVLQRALFPLAPGRLDIPASQLTYTLPRSASFFSREESATLRAADVTLFVKPLPNAGKPSGFSGAVGVLSLRASLSAPDARVGEPAVLTLRVSGRGNVKLWPRPAVVAPNATLVSAGERVSVDTSGQYVRGSKEFDWLLTPERAGELAIPSVEYAYFDPYEEAYRTASSDSIRVVIATGEFVAPPSGTVERDALVLRRTDRGPLGTPLSRHPLLWALVALAPLPAVLRGRRQRDDRARGRGERLPVDPVHLADPSPSVTDPAQHVRRVAANERKRLLAGLAERLATTTPMLVERAALERRLRRRGVTRETTSRVMRLLAELDAAAWSPNVELGAEHAERLSHRLDELLGAVRVEAVGGAGPGHSSSDDDAGGTGSARGARTIGMVLLLAGAAAAFASFANVRPLHAGAQDPADFGAAVTAFDAGRYAEAAAGFLALAEAQPRRADAWANAGTAAWVAHDTVAAVRGWQRAIRLEPSARDARAHLLLLPAGSWQGVASVPDVRRDLGTVVALLAWCLGWTLLALARRAPVPFLPGVGIAPLRAAGALLLVMSGGVALWQGRLERRLGAAPLSVVAGLEPLRVAPGRDANVFGGTSRGDVVQRTASRVDGATGVQWMAVVHADGREGWLPADALVPLQ